MAFKTKKISGAKTVGAKLKSVRIKKKITIEQAEEATKVRDKYLRAIEGGAWQEFPSRIYLLGYVRRYADFLDLDSNQILDEFKGEIGQFKVSVARRSISRTRRFIVTPKTIISSISIIILLSAVGYIFFSAQKLSRAPEINLIAPKELNVSEKEITIEGKTLDTAIVDINDQLVQVTDDGTFTQKVSLTEGLNIFEIHSKNRIGKEKTLELKVLYQPKK